MNCPKCGNPLRISKKDPAYGLCDNCKKKYRLPESNASDTPSQKAPAKKPADSANLDDITPVKKASRPVTDETKVIKAIQEIDESVGDTTTPERPAPKKRRPASEDSDTPKKKRRPAPEGSEKKPVQKRKRPTPPSQSGYYTDDQYDDEPAHKKKKYANIPPSKVRSSREDDMRAGYDELLSIENEKQGIGSTILTVIIVIVVLALIGGGVFYLYNRMKGGASSSSIDASSTERIVEAAERGTVVYEDDTVEVNI